MKIDGGVMLKLCLAYSQQTLLLWVISVTCMQLMYCQQHCVDVD